MGPQACFQKCPIRQISSCTPEIPNVKESYGSGPTNFRMKEGNSEILHKVHGLIVGA